MKNILDKRLNLELIIITIKNYYNISKNNILSFF